MLQKTEHNYQYPAFIELLTVDSTNNYALSLLRHPSMTERQMENIHGTSVFSHEQRQGKGQRGKTWISATNENLQMSLIVAPGPLHLYEQFNLTILTSIAAVNFMKEKSGLSFKIKWPNDIYFQDRKAGGILIENIISGMEWKWAVIGIGLNINQTEFDPALPNPVSLKQITGKEFDCVELAKELSRKVLEMVAGYKSRVTGYRLKVTGRRLRVTGCGSQGTGRRSQGTNDASPISNLLNEYNSLLYKRGEKVELKKDNRVFEATIKEVLASGQLVVETGMEERFDFGELVWIV